MYNIKPFVKWVGGKRQLIDKIKNRMPQKYNNYFEPFVGGGALFMDLQPKKCYLNDANFELINAYNVVKSSSQELMKLLDVHEKNHTQAPKDYFIKIREMDRDPNWNKVSKIHKAARFIYLNKTCFNGIYRVNSNGFFNVPFNDKEKVNTYSEDNLINLEAYLNDNDVIINNGDFSDILVYANKGDFIFFDPPYDLIKKDTFVNYTKDGFGEEGQKRLAKLAHKLSEKGCFVMITNHNTPLIRELYKNFNFDIVDSKRSINSKGSKRTGMDIIIYNYDTQGDLE